MAVIRLLFAVSFDKPPAYVGVHKSRMLGCLGDSISYGGAQYYWVLSVELVFVDLLVAVILRWRLDFWKICGPQP